MTARDITTSDSDDKAVLRELVTEDAYVARQRSCLLAFLTSPQSLRQSYRKHSWKHVGSVERPRIVHAAVFQAGEKNSLFAQVAVRMHSNQVRALFFHVNVSSRIT